MYHQLSGENMPSSVAQVHGNVRDYKSYAYSHRSPPIIQNHQCPLFLRKMHWRRTRVPSRTRYPFFYFCTLRQGFAFCTCRTDGTSRDCNCNYFFSLKWFDPPRVLHFFLLFPGFTRWFPTRGASDEMASSSTSDNRPREWIPQLISLCCSLLPC